MKKFFAVLWNATILILWLLSVLAIIHSGNYRGFDWYPSPGQTNIFHYPWLGVMLTSVVTAMECAFLYFIVLPQKLVWSLPRIALAFAIFLALSVLAAFTTPTDLPRYAYIPIDLTLLLTFLLFILLIITAIARFVRDISIRR